MAGEGHLPKMENKENVMNMINNEEWQVRRILPEMGSMIRFS